MTQTGCAPMSAPPATSSTRAERVANSQVRARAEAVARQKPTRCEIEFTADADRPWVAAFEKEADRGLNPGQLKVTITDPAAIQRLLDALRKSSRIKTMNVEPFDGMSAKQPMDEIVFLPADEEARWFRFLVEDLQDEWGQEFADEIEPIYRQATTKYMPKQSGK